eukprot:scaffold4487_cov273-Chaetoceros_neogracile.AAC.53
MEGRGWQRQGGDPDPRFLEFGNLNMMMKVKQHLITSKYNNYLKCEDEKANMSMNNPFFLYSIPEQCLPRSARVTNPTIRQAIRIRDQEGKRRQKVEEPIEATRLQEAWLKKQEEKQQNCQLLKDEKSVSQKKRSKKASRAAPNHIVGLEGGEQNTYELLDDDAGILALEVAVNKIIPTIGDADAGSLNDRQIFSTSWDPDCERRPSVISGESKSVVTMQLCSSSRSFVIDVQT